MYIYIDIDRYRYIDIPAFEGVCVGEECREGAQAERAAEDGGQPATEQHQ